MSRTRRPWPRLAWVVLLGCLAGCGQKGQRPTDRQAERAAPTPIEAGDDGRAILVRLVKAFGGVDKFKRWNAGFVRYTSRGGFVPIDGDAVVADTFQLPGHFKRVAYAAARGPLFSLTWVVNDCIGWEKRGNGEPRHIENAVTLNTEHPFADLYSLLPLLAKDVKLTRTGEEEVQGRSAVVVHAESETFVPVDFLFARSNALLLQSRKQVSDAQTGARVETTVYLEDYKEIQDGMVPLRIKGFQGGKPFCDLVLHEVKFVDSFPQRTFARPEKKAEGE